MAPDKSLAAEIEAVLRKHVRAIGQADEPDRFLIVDVKKAAAEAADIITRAALDPVATQIAALAPNTTGRTDRA